MTLWLLVAACAGFVAGLLYERVTTNLRLRPVIRHLDAIADRMKAAPRG